MLSNRGRLLSENDANRGMDIKTLSGWRQISTLTIACKNHKVVRILIGDDHPISVRGKGEIPRRFPNACDETGFADLAARSIHHPDRDAVVASI